MPSSRNNTEDTHSDETSITLDRLCRRAMRITSAGITAREHRLAARVATYCAAPDAPQEEPSDAYPAPPLDLICAMRAPVGTEQLVVMNIFDRKVRVIINPLGQRRPDRETAVWRCIIEQTLRGTA